MKDPAHRSIRRRYPCPSSPDRPGHLASHTSAVSLAYGALPALLLLIAPGSLVGIAARLPWPVAVAVGPALTYGVVGLSIIPLGAVGLPWNAWTALFAMALVTAVVIGLRPVLSRYRDRAAEALAVSIWPAVGVAAGVRPDALAVCAEHLGCGLARERGSLHPRHRAGVVDAHGRAAKRRDP